MRKKDDGMRNTGYSTAGTTVRRRTRRAAGQRAVSVRKNSRTYGSKTVYRKRKANRRNGQGNTVRLKRTVTVLIAFRVLATLFIIALIARAAAKRAGWGAEYAVGTGEGSVGTEEGSYRTENGMPAFISDLQDEKITEEGNEQKYIAIHFLGVPADGHSISSDGTGTHFYIYSDGTIYQSASLHKVPWQVGTAGCYEQLHDDACNRNTIGIEMCPLCDGNADDDTDPEWYFTQETQESCVLLVRSLMKELHIPAENVLRHGDIVSKYCPAPYFTNNHYSTSWTWDEFRENVRTLDKKQVPDFPFAY